MSSACDRTWEVEALRDGRMEADARASFARHVATCSHCQAEQRALDALAAQLRTVGAHVDDMALRRLRQRTIEQANDLVHSEPRSRKRKVSVALLGLAAAAAATFFVLTPLQIPREPRLAVQVEAGENARWHRARGRDIERIELSSGTLRFRVARKPSDPRLLVRVPDGEIEDLGTVFSVTVEGGKTREIAVREGRVVFHRAGAASLQLAAGTSWQAASPTLPAPRTEALPEPLPAPAPKEVAPAMKKPRHTTVQAVPPRAAQREAPEAGTGEDAAYLQILALLREGRRDEARLAAFAYLRAFPSGFRALEVSKVAAMPDVKAPQEGD